MRQFITNLLLIFLLKKSMIRIYNSAQMPQM